MGVKERKERQREALRAEILEAAGELFARDGYENVSMRQIAQRIEYSPTTIYLYFNDKADLFRQICEDTFARLTQKISAEKIRGTDPIDALLRGSRAYIDFGVAHPHHYLSTFVVHAQAPSHKHDQPFEETMGGKCFRNLQDGIAACMEAGVLRKQDVFETATTWWATLHGVTLLLITKMEHLGMDREKLIKGSFDMMVRGLAP